MTAKEVNEGLFLLNGLLQDTKKAGKDIPREIWDTLSAIKSEVFELWDFDRGNIYNCDECPHNCRFEVHRQNTEPCGQQHCWVDVSCNPEKFRRR